MDQAVREFFGAGCRNCQGLKEIMYQERRVTCPECKGSGSHRYSDTERASTMHLSYSRVKYSHHKIAWVLSTLGTEDRRMALLMSQQLDRLK